jgi:hypothetical protein
MTKQSCSWILAFEILELSATLKKSSAKELWKSKENSQMEMQEKNVQQQYLLSRMRTPYMVARPHMQVSYAKECTDDICTFDFVSACKFPVWQTQSIKYIWS